MILLLLGQALSPVEIPAVEWLSITWLLAGMWLVRRGTCLPLLLLTCPAFLCNPAKPWAWAQPLVALLFLIRILLDNPQPRRNLLRVLLVGAIMGWASWPSESGQHITEALAFPLGQLSLQWLHPGATWAIFPFRQTADRVLLAMLCAAIWNHKPYLHTPRIWRALFAGGLTSLAISIFSALVPWHTPHVFLGTTNFASYGPYLLHGAGDNACHLPILLAAAMPWFLVPLRYRTPWHHLGLAGLLPPLYFLLQRSLSLMVLVLLVSAIFLTAHALTQQTLRRRFLHRIRGLQAVRKPILLCLFLCLAVSTAWAWSKGLGDPSSRLRQTIRYALAQHGNPKPPAPAYGNISTDPKDGKASSTAEPAAWPPRLESFLARFDPARASMWSLAIQHASHDGLWHGQGAGTWARFHRSQPRPDRLYFAHLHNTYLDLVFEYGLIPMLCVFAWGAICLWRLASGKTGIPRVWLLYFATLATVAVGQHLLFPFSYQCLLLPGILVLLKVSAGMLPTRGQR